MTHSFPTRRSSELSLEEEAGCRRGAFAHQPRYRPLGHSERLADARQEGACRGGARGFRGSRRQGQGGEGTVRLLPLSEGLADRRSEEHTSELQSLMRISYAVF